MEVAIHRVEQALDRLAGIPLDRDLRQALRRDVFDRYRMIGDVFMGYPGLATRIQQAEMKLNAESGDRYQKAFPPADEMALRKLIDTLDDLRDYLEIEGTLHPLSAQQRQLFTQYLGEYAAELLANHCHAEFDRLVGEDRLDEGRALLTQLMTSLKTRGPRTDRVLELYHAAEAVINAHGRASNLSLSTRQAS
jgi:DNA-binding SARP family transcriptional activator